MTRPWLSLVIPAFNEAPRIQKTLDHILDYLRSRPGTFEVIVVDDGSEDGTATEVERRAEHEVNVIRMNRNQGKGAAVRLGIDNCRGELILLTDADLSAPIEELERLEDYPKNGFSVICGSRGLPDSDIRIRQPFYRDRMGKTFNLVVRALGLSSFRDTQCGFKLFRAAAAKDVFSRCRIDGFAFDVESLHIASRLGYRAVEVPIRWVHVPPSRVHLIRDSALMLWDLIRIRIRMSSWGRF